LGLLLLPDHKALDPALDLNGDEAKASHPFSRALDLQPRLSPSRASMQIKSQTPASVQAPLRRTAIKSQSLLRKSKSKASQAHTKIKSSQQKLIVSKIVFMNVLLNN
jgi:hypothetical protein